MAQLVYSAGGSGFTGANGSMMIEVVVRNLPAPQHRTLYRNPHADNRHVPCSHFSISLRTRLPPRSGRTICMPSLRLQSRRLHCHPSLPVRARFETLSVVLSVCVECALFDFVNTVNTVHRHRVLCTWVSEPR